MDMSQKSKSWTLSNKSFLNGSPVHDVETVWCSWRGGRGNDAEKVRWRRRESLLGDLIAWGREALIQLMVNQATRLRTHVHCIV